MQLGFTQSSETECNGAVSYGSLSLPPQATPRARSACVAGPLPPEPGMGAAGAGRPTVPSKMPEATAYLGQGGLLHDISPGELFEKEVGYCLSSGKDRRVMTRRAEIFLLGE